MLVPLNLKQTCISSICVFFEHFKQRGQFLNNKSSPFK